MKKVALSGVKSIVAISSGKGGVGKSTVAASLAHGLSDLGLQIGLLDADIFGPNIPSMMSMIDRPKIIEMPDGVEFFEPPSVDGIKIMSMGSLVESDEPMIWRGPKLHEVIQQFTSQVYWGECDILLIDMPPGTGDVQLSVAQILPLNGAVIVTTPQDLAVDDVKRSIHMWQKVNVPILGIVENFSEFVCPKCGKSHLVFGSGGADELSDRFVTEVIGRIPLAANNSNPVNLAKTDEFRNLTKSLIRLLSGAAKAETPVIGKF